MANQQRRDPEEAVHPIQVVCRRTGLGPDVIRAWEKRYGAVAPQRTATARRLYTDADIERLQLLRRATANGRRIGDVAQLPTEALRALVGEDESAALPLEEVRPPSSALLDASVEAVTALNARELRTLFYRASQDYPLPALLDDFLGPLFNVIGERVRSGSLRIVHEHMATAAAQAYLATLQPMATPNQVLGPKLIIGTPSGQVHEIGAQMAAIAAAAEGWDVLYLGPNLPAEEFAAAARQLDARVLALSVVCADADPRLQQQLLALRQHLPDVALLIGGGYAQLRPEVFAHVQATVVTSYADFRQRLGALAPAIGRRSPQDKS